MYVKTKVDLLFCARTHGRHLYGKTVASSSCALFNRRICITDCILRDFEYLFMFTIALWRTAQTSEAAVFWAVG